MLRAATSLALAASAYCAWTTPVSAAPGDLRANPVYRQMVRQSAGVRSSQCDIEVHTKLKGFPPASFTFHGQSYFKAPDRQTVVFDNVPGPLRGMFKDSPHIAPAATWPSLYRVSVTNDDGTTTTFHLVPKDPNSPIDNADVLVDDRTGLVSQFVFTNRNGSTVTTNNTYQRVGRHMVVAAQTGSANGHGYRADVTSSFTNCRFNVPVPDSVFTDNQ